jgi:hypothetical protein
MNLDEYCLCEKDSAGRSATGRKNSTAIPMLAPPRAVSRDDSFGSDDGSGGGEARDKPPPMMEEEEEAAVEILVTIIFPGSGKMEILCQASTSMVDLLSRIAEQHRIRLFTGEYVFVMTKQEQQRLMLMSPIVDNKATVKSTGTTVFEVHNK